MTAVQIFSFTLLSAALFAIVASEQAQEGPQGPNLNKVIESLLPPPLWVPCNYTETQGSVCKDCHTRFVCTKIGGFVRPCWNPFSRHCVEGKCASKPSEECSSPPSPPPTTEEPTTPAVTTEAATSEASKPSEPEEVASE